jgi:predicted dehydrogenase
MLCEKPISDNYPDSIQVVERAAREHIPFMIAENYRRRLVVRKLKALIDEGAIGHLSALHVDFYRHFHTEKAYFLAMPDPLLVDVAIHHFDMIRYFTGSEGRHIFARSYNPPGSAYTGNMNLNVFLEMENGVIVSFNGSMVASAPETPWNGNWIIEGTQGALLLTNDQITLVRDGQPTPVDDLSGVVERTSLQDFIQALAEHREAETWGPDYLKTQALVHFAQESSRAQCMLAVEHHKLTPS